MLHLPFTRAADLPLAVAAIREAQRRHGVVAIPTETFYGLAVDPRDRRAVQAVHAIKGRDPGKGLPVVGASLEQLAELVAMTAEQRRVLAEAWPAPLTVVLPVRSVAGLATPTLAVRVPDHTLLRDLLARVGALTATSANVSGSQAMADASRVAATFGAELDVLLDGGVTPGRAPSTLLDWSGGQPRVLRSGAWTPPSEWRVKDL